MAQERQDLTLDSELLERKDLPQQLQEKMNRIKAQRKQVDLYTADLDLLLKRFDVEKSLFGRIASQFSSLSWWQKGLIGLVVGGVFALVGSMFSIAVVIALPILALALYATLAYLFDEYTESDINRFNQLSEGVVRREKEMKLSVLELQQTENEIYELLDQLKELGGNYTEVIDK